MLLSQDWHPRPLYMYFSPLLSFRSRSLDMFSNRHQPTAQALMNSTVRQPLDTVAT
jgi:hypothetical protein